MTCLHLNDISQARLGPGMAETCSGMPLDLMHLAASSHNYVLH
jgi:hypothetical protein